MNIKNRINNIIKYKPENPFIHGNYFPNTIIMSLPRKQQTVPNLIKLTQQISVQFSFQFIISGSHPLSLPLLVEILLARQRWHKCDFLSL